MAWDVGTGSGHGYPDWEAAQAGPNAGQDTVPVFLTLPTADDWNALKSHIRDVTDAGLTPMPQELKRLKSEAKADPTAPWTYRLVGHARRSGVPAIAALAGVTVVHVGPAFHPGAGADTDPFQIPRRWADTTDTAPPIIAAIDDGIPFLQARLRQTVNSTRFAAVWLQADGSGPKATDEARPGRVLAGSDINGMIRRGDEAEVYREVNRALYPIGRHAATDHHASHAAMVLDVAAGAAPEGAADPLRDIRLLGVQLPPAAVRDTSGRRNEAWVVQGLRWCIAQAVALNRQGAPGPLIVTNTLGALAGPGDESQFLADWFRYEVASYRLLTGRELHIVNAFGNQHRDKLVARDRVSTAHPLTLDWCIQPEDMSPSFVEIRTTSPAPKSLRLRVTPPGGLAPLDINFPDPELAMTLPGAAPGGRPVAALYGLANGATSGALLAVAPTERYSNGPIAPSGRWRIEVTAGMGLPEPAVVTVAVQRDDTPVGYRLLGRQSMLDHPLASEWDEQVRHYVKPLSAYMPGAAAGLSPVSRLGTAIAHANPKDPRIEMVGSVKPIIGHPDQRVPSLYSPSGTNDDPAVPARDEVAAPTLSAFADDGSNLYGRLGAGVLSGSSARLSGTSFAAPALARARVLDYLTQIATGGAVTPSPVADLTDTVIDPPDRVIGQGVLSGQRSYERGSVLDPSRTGTTPILSNPTS